MATPSTSRLYGKVPPADQPAHRLADVAHFLWVSDGKLGRWASGYTAEGKRHAPLIRVADRERGLLSFNNLAELHVLSSLRYQRVPLQRVRRAMTWVRHNLLGDDHLHPLLALEFQTDGLDLFVDKLGVGLINVSSYGQMAMKDIFSAYLRRIDRDPNSGTAIKLFPFVRPFRSPIDADAQPKTVSIDPLIAFGRPVLAGTRIPTDELAERFSAGEPIESIAKDLDLEPETVQDAIRYQLAPRAAA